MTVPWRILEGPAGQLRSYVTEAPQGAPPVVLVLCHELPRWRTGAEVAGRLYPMLADRLCVECGLRVTVGTLRGVGGSEGDFSASGWLDDLRFLVDNEVGADGRVLVAGFGLGGALALRLAVEEPRVCGVATFAAAADLGPWAADPQGLVASCRAVGVLSTPGFPADPAAWAAELVALDPMAAAAGLGDRPLLVVHGSDDPDVAVGAATELAAAASGPVDQRIIPGAGHWLQADPRVVATLIGWTERQR
ncbi:MAG: alpha/beta hydrolase [Acidimicrobiales bacterium]